MEITNEQLYEMYKDLRSDMDNLYKLHMETRAELKTDIAELRADIAKWGVALFAGSIVVMTSIIGTFVAIVAL